MQQRKFLKLCLNGKIKRATLYCDFENFKYETTQLYNISDLDQYELLYLDDENDIIQIENQYDYDHALLYLLQSNFKTLKIRIMPKYDYNYDYSKLIIDSHYNNTITEEIEYINCQKCNRTFNTLSYEKHSKVCQKVFFSRRTPYNSRKKRLTREQVIYLLTNRNRMSNYYTKKINNWRKKSEEFRKMLNELKRNEELVYCKICYRKFNERSIEKHEKYCENVFFSNRKPFESRRQRLKVEKINNYPKVEKKWKQKSEKLRTIVKLRKQLFN